MVHIFTISKKINQFSIYYAVLLLVLYAFNVDIVLLGNIGTLLGIVPVTENSYKLYSFIKQQIINQIRVH